MTAFALKARDMRREILNQNFAHLTIYLLGGRISCVLHVFNITSAFNSNANLAVTLSQCGDEAASGKICSNI